MITPAPHKNTLFNEAYPILGEYVQDDSRIPYFNPSDSDTLIQPGEPLLVQFGGANQVWMAQGPIAPGEIGMLIRYYTADFPATISANVIMGTPIYWDVDNEVAAVAGDVTNGFLIGNAVWAIDPNIKNDLPTVDGNDRVIAAVSTDDKIRVISAGKDATVQGSVTPMAAFGAPEPAKKASKKKAE